MTGLADENTANGNRHSTTANPRRILLVGLICFGLWLLLDAQQLYRAADASPFGTRRSVAMAILYPIAAFDRTFHLSGIVNTADGLLGRSGTVGGSAGSIVATPPTIHPTAPERAGNGTRGGKGGVERGGKHTLSPESTPASTTPQVWPPPIAGPSAAHPITVLEMGDSLGEDLGFGLADVITNPYVHVLQKAVGDTGLARPDYYNWPAELSVLLAQYHPQIVIVFLGGNDAQSFFQNGRIFSFGTPSWKAAYATRVGTVMKEATAAGAHVLWVGMPIMASGTLSSDMRTLNSIFRSQAAIHPGVTYMSSWKLFTNTSGAYSAYLPDASGNEVLARNPDGVHLYQAGDDRLARASVGEAKMAWHVDL